MVVSRRPDPAAGGLHMTTNVLRRLYRALRRWHDHRNSVRALSALDDRRLNDVGIERDDIPRVVEERLADRHRSPPTSSYRCGGEPHRRE